MHDTHGAAGTGDVLIFLLVLLAGAVIAVPLANRAKLGSIIGYLAAGILIGPQALGLVSSPGTILTVSELGIVLFLFLIGLEMQPSRIWTMRRDIFGLGGAQVLVSGVMIMFVPLAFGRSLEASVVAGFGLAITSTAILMQILAERGEVQSPHGQRAFAVSIFQDLMIVPLLALVAVLAPSVAPSSEPWWIGAAKIAGAVAVVILIGRYLLNPLFRLVATSATREIMTAAGLLVVIGAATVMTFAGLSMGMGAFLAGVLLSESKFRHQLTADIEPFRGLLMGLFFMAIGMTVDLGVVVQNWWRLAVALVALIVIKGVVMYAVMRAFRFQHEQSVKVALLMAQAGEFGFVLYAAAQANGVMQPDHASILVALTVISMALSPFVYRLLPVLVRKPKDAPEREEDFTDVKGSVLVIGFGRFGQIACQMLLAEGVNVTVIDNDVEMIEAAERFIGFKVYYGDGSRYDVLRAAGADEARLILVCTDNPETTTEIVRMCKTAFPLAQIHARAYDRVHALALIEAGVDVQMRETFESALRFGGEALSALDLPVERVEAVEQDIRARDRARFAAQQAGDAEAGRRIMYGNQGVRPEPLVPSRRPPSERDSPTRPAEAQSIDGGAGL